MSTLPPDYDRLMELLAGRALGDLDAAESNELESLLGGMSPAQSASVKKAREDFEKLKGATLAGWKSSEATMPADVRSRILAAGKPLIAKEHAGRSVVVAPGMRPREGLAWLAAAASIALAILAWNRPVGPRLMEPAWQARADLLRDADSKTLAWSTTDDPGAKGVGGDIVWNAKQQRGFMRFKGLSANDPRLQQYQLWIFDKGREGEFPVDGGVFDINAASKDPKTGDLVVPVTPKLAVRDPAMFAVTLEMPGGVVVTKRDRLLLLAKNEEK